MEKYISSDTLCDLAEVVLKNNIFKSGKKPLKQKKGTAIGTKFAPRSSILFMAELEDTVLQKKKNLNRIYGGGRLMICFSFASMEKKI